MNTLTTHRPTNAARRLAWLVPAALAVAVAATTTLMSLAPSAETAMPADPPVTAPAPPPVYQPDASAVDWSKIEAAPDASGLSVAAYGESP